MGLRGEVTRLLVRCLHSVVPASSPHGTRFFLATPGALLQDRCGRCRGRNGAPTLGAKMTLRAMGSAPRALSVLAPSRPRHALAIILRRGLFFGLRAAICFTGAAINRAGSVKSGVVQTGHPELVRSPPCPGFLRTTFPRLSRDAESFLVGISKAPELDQGEPQGSLGCSQGEQCPRICTGATC